MPTTDADSRARSRSGRPRKWGNRRPPGQRLALTPEEAERRAEERREKQAREFISVRMNKAEKATIAARASAYGMRLSDFVRTVLLSDLKELPPPRTDPAALMKLAYRIVEGGNEPQPAREAGERGGEDRRRQGACGAHGDGN